MPDQNPIAELLPRDYIATAEELYFAVVLTAATGQAVHCSLRYARERDGTPRKLDTAAAYDLLKSRYPCYLSHSDFLDTETVMVPREAITRVYRPRETPARLQRYAGDDGLKQAAMQVIRHFNRTGIRRGDLGITGSLMLDFHTPESDIDIVVYEPSAFERARQAVRESLAAGELEALDDADWRRAYERRACALDYDEYLHHERRKFNKFMLAGYKCDISYVSGDSACEPGPGTRKLGRSSIRARVSDASGAFDYPARYELDSDELQRIYCYTATYTGQAFKGETVEAAGMLECDSTGRRYMVIGTSREAPEEYLKVVAS